MDFKSNKVKGGAICGALLCATVSVNEGYVKTAYLDSVGIPTICVGHTGGVTMGTTLSDSECQTLFNEDIQWAVRAFDSNVKTVVGVHTAVSMIDFIFNVGAKAFKDSTMLRKLNSGDIVGACNEFPKWNKAGGKYSQGLANRRERSRKQCLQF